MKLAVDFSPTFCNFIRIGQNIKNEVSEERSIFADVASHQLNSLN